MSFIQVMTTTETRQQAQAIARRLVEDKLAACVQISQAIESTYLWQGRIECSQEVLCAIKTREDLFPQVEAVIKKMHPYETPEIIALPIAKGSKDYLQWLDETLLKTG
ncbi:MAG TPA: divalent-cation tolerance protein CutA [Smithellaceae bacterium]|nr:divalent-cation tolerance protein CutA [Smithellaceae bacterium]